MGNVGEDWNCGVPKSTNWSTNMLSDSPSNPCCLSVHNISKVSAFAVPTVTTSHSWCTDVPNMRVFPACMQSRFDTVHLLAQLGRPRGRQNSVWGFGLRIPQPNFRLRFQEGGIPWLCCSCTCEMAQLPVKPLSISCLLNHCHFFSSRAMQQPNLRLID